MTIREPALDEVSRALRRERDRLEDEVLAYPRPIPACDVQFNTLLEQRAAATAEYTRWEALRTRAPVDREELCEFLRSSVTLADDAKKRLLGSLD